jgi:hypothetical protein
MWSVVGHKTNELIGIISISSGRGGLQVTMKRTLMFSSESGGEFDIWPLRPAHMFQFWWAITVHNTHVWCLMMLVSTSISAGRTAGAPVVVHMRKWSHGPHASVRGWLWALVCRYHLAARGNPSAPRVDSSIDLLLPSLSPTLVTMVAGFVFKRGRGSCMQSVQAAELGWRG